MKTKSKVLISALLVIALCVSLIAGTTFALFSSEDKVNIAVTSGKVNVKATPSLSEDSVLYEGSAKLDEKTGIYTVSNVVPKDKVVINVAVLNSSTITVKYRTTVSLKDVVGKWNISINGVQYTGSDVSSKWETLAVGTNPKDIIVSVELDKDETNQDSTCNILCKVEATQGNAETSNLPAGYEGYVEVVDGASMAQALANGNEDIYLSEDLSFKNSYLDAHPCDVEEILKPENDAALTEYIEAYIAYKNYKTTTVEKIKERIDKRGFEEVFGESVDMSFAESKTIDLGGNLLNLDNVGLAVKEGGDLTIKNGNLAVGSIYTGGIDIESGTTVTFENVTINMVGEISSSGNLVLKNCHISGSMNGLLSLSGNTTVIENCTIENKDGDAINLKDGGKLTIRDSEISGCETMYSKPNVCIWNQGGTMEIYNSTLIALPNSEGVNINGTPKKAVYDETGARKIYVGQGNLMSE